MKGVYTLIIRFASPCRTSLAEQGSILLGRGLYLYTGSAQGRGSTSLRRRVQRHLGHKKKQFWHIDRILACESARVISVVFAETRGKLECRVNAGLLRDSRVGIVGIGIGSSDCRCKSHFLAAKPSLLLLTRIVKSSYVRLGLRPLVRRITPRLLLTSLGT